MKTDSKRVVSKATISDVARCLGHDADGTAYGCGPTVDITELTVTELECVAGGGDQVIHLRNEVP